MAKIPTIEPVGSGGVPSSVVGYKATSGTEELPGQALAGLGEVLQKSGSALMAEDSQNKERDAARLQHSMQVLQEKQDTIRAEDAWNNYRTRALDMAAGEKGYLKLKGSQVATNPNLFKDVTTQLNEDAKKVAEGLANEDQRSKFKARADVTIYQSQHDLLNHITREQGVYAQQVYKGTIETEQQQASVRWDQPAAVQMSIDRMKEATRIEGERTGSPADMIKAQNFENESKIHAAVIGQALETHNYAYAQQWFKQNRENIDTATAKTIERAVYEGVQKQVFNGYQNDFINNGRTLGGLNALQAKVAKDPVLDETRKTALLGRIEGRMESIQRRAEMAADRAERQLERQITQTTNLVMQGYEPTVEQLTPLINATRGTALAPEVNRLVVAANETGKFRRLPPIERGQYLNRLESAVRDDPTKYDVTAVSRLRAIDKNLTEQARENPIGFVVRQGFVDPTNPAVTPMDFTKPETLGAQLTQKFDLARQVAARWQTSNKPLQPEEVQGLKTLTASMSAEQRTDYFGRLAKASISDKPGYRAMMNQIAPDDPVVAAGGIAAQRGLTDQRATMVANSIFRGQALLNPPKKEDGKPAGGALVKMPVGDQQRAMEGDFNNLIGNAYQGAANSRSILFQTARAIYADKIESKQKMDGILDSSLWKQSIKMALGAEPTTYGGRIVIPPPGMEQSDFKDQLRARILEIEKNPNLPDNLKTGDLRALPIINKFDGVYVFMSGDKRILGKDGNEIVIDFNQPFQMPVPANRAGVVGASEYGFASTGGDAATGMARRRKPAEATK